jgi:hypothetical protein
MRAESRAVVVAIGLGFGAALSIAGAQAQTTVIQTIALKSGETQDLGPVYYVRNCRSITVGKPEVEILDGPPNLAVTIKEGEVVPRAQGCANKVPGGTLQLTAPKEIEDPSFMRLVIRVTFKTKAEGEHKASLVYNVSLIP